MFLAKTNFPQREVYWSSFYTKHDLIPFKVAHFSAKWVCFSVFAAENLNHWFRFNERKQAEAKQIRARHGWHLWCNQKSQWLILCAKTDVIFRLLINDWSSLWVNIKKNQINWKEMWFECEQPFVGAQHFN